MLKGTNLGKVNISFANNVHFYSNFQSSTPYADMYFKQALKYATDGGSDGNLLHYNV